MLTESKRNPGLWFKYDEDRKVWDWDMMMREDSNEVRYVHDNLRVVVGYMLNIAYEMDLPDQSLVVTSLWRTNDPGVHGHGRGVDFRMKEGFDGRPGPHASGLTLDQARMLTADINEMFPPYRGWVPGRVHDTVVFKPHGTAPHLHVQVAAKHGYLSSNSGVMRQQADVATTEEIVGQMKHQRGGDTG